MMPYVIGHVAWDELEDSPEPTCSFTVMEEIPHSRYTGLLDQHGVKIYHVSEKLAFGFVTP